MILKFKKYVKKCQQWIVLLIFHLNLAKKHIDNIDYLCYSEISPSSSFGCSVMWKIQGEINMVKWILLAVVATTLMVIGLRWESGDLGVLVYPGFLLAGILVFAFTKPESDAERGNKAYAWNLREVYIVALTPLCTIEVLIRLNAVTTGQDKFGILVIGLIASAAVWYLEIGGNRSYRG